MMWQWRMLPEMQFYPGYALGSHYPSLVVALERCGPVPDRRRALLQRLQELVPGLEVNALSHGLPHTTFAGEEPAASLQWLLALCQQLQQASGLAVFETGRVLSFAQLQARCQVPVAAQGQPAMAATLQQILAWLAQELASGASGSAHAPTDPLAEALHALAAHAISGSNSGRFFRAALELGIPVERLPGGIIQYGMGSQRRRLESSYTDETSGIAAKMARNKAISNALFAQAGLPVPRQTRVENADAAVAAAQRIGYPVVVKPADLDGGCGVAAGLESADAVRRAFAGARQLSAHVVVEQHVAGRDYRLTVFQGELIWAIERIPAHVTGDGRLTIAQLITDKNADPRRGSGHGAALKRLVLDAEAQTLLAGQGLDATSIAAAGQTVLLRRAANVATGGEPVAVFDKVHPDNARLAVRAAEQLGLDLAGIDLLIPDVAMSWRAPGNTPAICEINGQPNLGQITAPHIYGQILRRLLKSRGRVPSIVVLGAQNPLLWLQTLQHSLARRGLRVGTAGPEGVYLVGEPVTTGPVSAFKAGKMLLLDPGVDAVVVAVTCTSWLSAGLPWARYDTLVVAGSALPGITATGARLSLEQWLHALLPACDGHVFIEAKGAPGAPPGQARMHCVERFDAQTVEAIAEMTLALHREATA